MSTPFAKTTTERNVEHTMLENDKQLEKFYVIGKKLGEGAFGIVHQVTSRKTQKPWAMKTVGKDKAMSIQLLEREVNILKRLAHDHVIYLNEVYETKKNMYLIMEMCNKGELADLLRDRGAFTEQETKQIIQALADALQYLHKQGIVHRDLKLENILMAQNPRNPNDDLYVKITDFGLSVVKGGVGHEAMLKDFCGTPMYMSPEIIDSKNYSQQCDVWAMGVIAYTLIEGEPPFKAPAEEELFKYIRKGDVDFSSVVWREVSSQAKECIKGMLRIDPAHRLTAKEVFESTWLTGKAGQANVLDMMKSQRRSSTISMDSVESIGSIASCKAGAGAGRKSGTSLCSFAGDDMDSLGSIDDELTPQASRSKGALGASKSGGKLGGSKSGAKLGVSKSKGGVGASKSGRLK